VIRIPPRPARAAVLAGLLASEAIGVGRGAIRQSQGGELELELQLGAHRQSEADRTAEPAAANARMKGVGEATAEGWGLRVSAECCDEMAGACHGLSLADMLSAVRCAVLSCWRMREGELADERQWMASWKQALRERARELAGDEAGVTLGVSDEGGVGGGGERGETWSDLPGSPELKTRLYQVVSCTLRP
jgi:hypothetical protein